MNVLPCRCHGNTNVAAVNKDRQSITVRRRSHGTNHEAEFTISDLVRLLDPAGTSFTAVM